MSRGQGCCYTSYNAKNSPPQGRIIRAKMSVALWLRSPDLESKECLFNLLYIVQANGNVFNGSGEGIRAFNIIIY